MANAFRIDKVLCLATCCWLYEIADSTNLLCKSVCRCSVFLFTNASFFGHFYIDTRIARMFLSLRMIDLWPLLPDEMYNQKTATKKAFYLHFLRYDALNSSTENEITRYVYIVQQNGLFTVRSSEMCHQPEHMLLPLVCLQLTFCFTCKTNQKKFRCCSSFICVHLLFTVNFYSSLQLPLYRLKVQVFNISDCNFFITFIAHFVHHSLNI